MADSIVTGLAELERRLRAAPEAIERKFGRTALAAAARVVRDEARQCVPVDSGALRDSVRTSSRAGKGTAGPSVQVKAGGRVRGKSVRHAHLVEFGTAPHEIRPKGAKSLFIAGVMRTLVKHPGARARPFLRPALDAKGDEATAAFAANLRGRLDKEGL